MKDRLSEVRAAIVKACPEIESCKFCGATPYNFDQTCVEGMHDEVVVRDIHLADVLRAIALEQNKGRGFGFSINAYGGMYKTESPDWEEIHVGDWNLANDNLDDASPKTIALIHSIICP